MIKAIIFDFDGVILDSEPIHFKAWVEVLEALEITLSYQEYTKHFLGFTDKDGLPRFLLEQGHNFISEKIDLLIHSKNNAFEEIIKNTKYLPTIEGLTPFLDSISNFIYKFAICSGSTRNEIITTLSQLENAELLPIFSTIVSSEDVQLGKPSPEGYLLTAEKLNVSPNQCLVIEDTAHGIKAAKEADMYAVGILTSFNAKQLNHADKIIRNFDELSADLIFSSHRRI